MVYFTGLGTVVNVLAIVAGGLLGLMLRGGLKEQYQNGIIRVLGIATMFIGAGGALSGMLVVQGDKLRSGESLGMILALVLGTLVGEILDFDGRMEGLGIFLKKSATRGEDSRFVEGFVTASLVVCVGAMAVVGALQDALAADPSTLYTKSILDLLIVMIFAATYGKGAVFSALPVGVWQGAITLCAAAVAPVFGPAVIENLSFIGSVLIFCVGANLAFDARFRVANMLPALVVGGVFVSVMPLLQAAMS